MNNNRSFRYCSLLLKNFRSFAEALSECGQRYGQRKELSGKSVTTVFTLPSQLEELFLRGKESRQKLRLDGVQNDSPAQ